eukprot:TRINITY_DN236_c0_g2_i2.p1 TRINITY_DN236_c0_g2~~TRINITY_DN236_c0_g2_i2.p1  ORF type:complete len:379 (-),score=32.85 TRINITY_DN236_c0_g2_i2:253-1389(-)
MKTNKVKNITNTKPSKQDTTNIKKNNENKKEVSNSFKSALKLSKSPLKLLLLIKNFLKTLKLLKIFNKAMQSIARIFFVIISITSTGVQSQMNFGNATNSDTSLCVWDEEIGCKANPAVKKFLEDNSMQEQQIAGASRCMVEDNPTDCNSLEGCIYEDNGDETWFCVQDLFSEQNPSEVLQRRRENQEIVKNCFKKDSALYITMDCQSREVCDGVCAVNFLMPGSCNPNPDTMSSTQQTNFIQFSTILSEVEGNNDNQQLTQFIADSIADDANYFCKNVISKTFACTMGTLAGGDSCDFDECSDIVPTGVTSCNEVSCETDLVTNDGYCQKSCNRCESSYPASFYWEDSGDAKMFNDMQTCKQNLQQECAERKVSLNK